ncbi:MAG TPA: hypothetical protein VF621_20910 [Pyrinomonadaceae bacterium]
MEHRADDPADGVLAALRRLSPRLYGLIREHADTPLAEYARSLWQTPPEPSSAAGQRARRHLMAALEGHLKAVGSPATQADEALRQFERCPVLQTADHSELLLDPHSFHTNLLYHVGARATGNRFLFVNAASTVTFETWRAHGPGWLNVRGARVNVFGLSRRSLTGTSVCAAPGPFRFRLAVDKDAHTLNDAESAYLEELRGLLGGREYESAPAAFAAVNGIMWGSWGDARSTTPVITDDRLTASLVARHLADGQSLLGRMLFTHDVRARLEGELARIASGAGRWALPSTTQHFWGVRDGRIRPLRVADGELREVGAREGFRLTFEREAVARALVAGRLYPNLFIGFLALSTLPRVRVLGGHRQFTYVPLVNEVCENVLRSWPGCEADDLLEDIRRGPADGFIAGIIEEERHPLSLVSQQPAGTQLARLSERWSAVTLRESLGRLRAFEHLRNIDERQRAATSRSGEV